MGLHGLDLIFVFFLVFIPVPIIIIYWVIKAISRYFNQRLQATESLQSEVAALREESHQ